MRSKITKKLALRFLYLAVIILLSNSTSADVGDICPSGLEINGGQCALYDGIRENLSLCGLTDFNQASNSINFEIEISFAGSSECVKISDTEKYFYGQESSCPSGYGVKNIDSQKVGCLNSHQAAAANYLLENGDLPPGILTAETIPYPTEEISLDLAERVNNFYIWALGIGGMVALGIIIFGGVLYSASGGNPSRMGEAKTWIQSALFGLALLFSSYLLLNFLNPNLTRLQEIFLDPNPQVQGPTLAHLPGGGGNAYAQCIADAVKNVTTYGSCDGYYVSSEDGRTFARGRHRLAKAGNFGDPDCDRQKMTETAFVAELRDEVEKQLNLVKDRIPQEFRCDYNLGRLKYILVDGWEGHEAVVAGESRYNPNALLLGKDCETDREGSPDPNGAWGLFQMGKTGSPMGGLIDNGDVPWREQVANAVAKLVEEPRGHCYWATWPGRTGMTCPCSTCIPRYVACVEGENRPQGPGYVNDDPYID